MKGKTLGITVLILAFASPILLAQEVVFEKTFGGGGNDYGRSVQETSDGGFIIAGGTSSSGAGSWDVYLIRTDGDGNEMWHRTFGGSNNDYGRSVQETSDGGFIIVGSTSSFGAGNGDVYLIKTDGDGNEIWHRTFGGSNYDYGYSVQETSDGGFIIAGGTSSSGVGKRYIYLIRTDGDGNEIWHRTFGGSNYGYGYPVQETSDGGFIIVGRTSSFGAGSDDVYLIRTDGDGNEIWHRTFGGSNYDYGYSVQETSDGGFIIAGGTSSSGAGSWDVYLIRTDGDGNEMWHRTFGGSNNDYGYSVQETSDGGFIIIGRTSSFGAGSWDVYLIRTDGDGNEIWHKTFGGSDDDYGYSVQETSDGGFIIVGRTSSFGAGSWDVYLIKLKPGITSLTSPTHPSQDKWYASPNVTFSWEPQVQGIIGYYVALSRNNPINLTPENAQDYVVGTGKSYTDLEDGIWYFNIKGEFQGGSLTLPNAYRVQIDSTPHLSSDTHPDQQMWYRSKDARLKWSIQDISSARAFYYILDDKPDTVPDRSKATKTDSTSLEITLSSADEWHFHLVWEDEMGNLSRPAHYRIGVDTTPPDPVTDISLHITPDGKIKLRWSEPRDNASGVGSYQIFRTKFKGAVGTRIATDVEETEFVDEAAQRERIYYYTVMPVDRAGNKQVEGNVQASSEDAVVEGELSVKPRSGHVGDEIVVSGEGFNPGETVNVRLETVKISAKADDEGRFSIKLKVPTLPGGKHRLIAEGDGRKTEGTFLVEARIKEISPNEASVGSVITILGDGFSAGVEISVKIGGRPVSVVGGGRTSESGELAVEAVVPDLGLGLQGIMASDGQREVRSSIQVVEGEPVADGKSRFRMELSEGLNMVSMPLKPDFDLDARKFAQMLDATVVIRLNRETKQFEPFIPELGTVNFPINGGEGYIVNMLEGKTVNVEGRAWFGAPDRDGDSKATDRQVWAFAVGGVLLFGDQVEVRNTRSGEVVVGHVRDGWFTAVLGGVKGEDAVRAGDEIVISVYEGGKTAGKGKIRIGIKELERAVGLVHVDRLPSRTILLPNYPNPFNPETWMPFRLARDGEVVIRIYDVRGRLVRELDLGMLEAGVYEGKGRAAYWDGRNEMGEEVSSGIYVIEFSVGRYHAFRKMCLMR
jgi:hypothetical protein